MECGPSFVFLLQALQMLEQASLVQGAMEPSKRDLSLYEGV